MQPYLGPPWTNSCQIWCVRVFHHVLLKYCHENAEMQKRKFDDVTLHYSIFFNCTFFFPEQGFLLQKIQLKTYKKYDLCTLISLNRNDHLNMNCRWEQQVGKSIPFPSKQLIWPLDHNFLLQLTAIASFACTSTDLVSWYHTCLSSTQLMGSKTHSNCVITVLERDTSTVVFRWVW